jgi:hypothetical protein
LIYLSVPPPPIDEIIIPFQTPPPPPPLTPISNSFLSRSPPSDRLQLAIDDTIVKPHRLINKTLGNISHMSFVCSKIHFFLYLFIFILKAY